jgi:hypothetical protein
MSIQELEEEIRLLPREEQDRLAAFLTALRLEENPESYEDQEFVLWDHVREEFLAPGQ